MIPDNVTVIVKAPNQQIEDQNIECQSSWTVKQLKGYLSEVYPSKPRTDEQKIIYSGQLLDDNIILKDVLRTYECQIAHTMHLVCTPNRRMEPPSKPAETPTVPDGLRHRNVGDNQSTERAEATPRPEMRQNDQNHTVEMQNYISSFVNNYGRVPPYPNYNLGEGYLPVPNDPASLANHMLMIQQAYLQYMQQYANMWQASNAMPAPAPAPETAVPPPADAGAGAGAADAGAAGAGAEEGEEGAARDWLDHLYSASRLAILFFLVYLYGSGARLLLVLLLAAAGYLHQIGFFRDLHLNPANVANNQNNQPPRNNQPQQLVNDNPPPNAQPADNELVANTNPPPADNQQSLLAVTWMVFSSFFASLIPDAN